MVFALIAAVLMLIAARADGLVFSMLCIAAAIFIQLRLLANVLDGLVADSGAQATLAGRLFNEWPDRVSDVMILSSFGWMIVDPAMRMLGALAACLAVMTAYTRELGRCIDAPQMFQGPMAKQHRMATLTIALIVMAAWPGSAERIATVADRVIALPAITLLVVIMGCTLTIYRRLRALHRFAFDNKAQRHDTY